MSTFFFFGGLPSCLAISFLLFWCSASLFILLSFSWYDISLYLIAFYTPNPLEYTLLSTFLLFLYSDPFHPSNLFHLLC